jgi:hypothetical protein
MDPTEDRSWPLKRWAVGALSTGIGALALATRLLGSPLSVRQGWSLAVMAAATPLAVVLLFMFVSEPVRATRRMVLDPPKGPLVGRLPPTLGPSVWFVVLTFAAAFVGAPVALDALSSPLLLLSAWCSVFVAGVGGVMGGLAARARSVERGATAARVYGFVTLFVASVGLWIVAALAGAMDDPTRHPFALLGAAPTWVAPAAIDALASPARPSSPEAERALRVGIGVWTFVAAVSLGAMARALRRRRADDSASR